MLFYYIHKMTWAYDFFKTVLPFKSSFFKNPMYRTMYHIPYLLKQSTIGKPRF